MKHTRNSEAVGRLAAALAHGDIHHPPWRYIVPRSPSPRRKAKAWLKKHPVRIFQPRIEFFEEEDLPMLAPPSPSPSPPPRRVVMVHPVTVSPELRAQIVRESEQRQQIQKALEKTQRALHAARFELETAKARVRFWERWL